MLEFREMICTASGKSEYLIAQSEQRRDLYTVFYDITRLYMHVPTRITQNRRLMRYEWPSRDKAIVEKRGRPYIIR